MEDKTSKGKCAPLSLSALQLLVSPIRLVSAAIWQTVQQKVVADYGMLDEFVTMVSDIVPELLTTQQRVQLVLGLRARVILELCQFEATAHLELVQPHLDRVQMLIEAWVTEVGDTNTEVPCSEFVDLVKNLLRSPEERERFFQNVFPEEFGPAYDEALHTLMWMFLSRLEKFLPLQTFQQVADMLGGVSSVLEECMGSVSQHEEFKTLLQYQKDFSQLDHNDDSLIGACIISAVKLPSAQRTETDKTQPQASISNNVLPCTSDLEKESSTLPHTITEDQTNCTPGQNVSVVLFSEENVGLVTSEAEDTTPLLKQCSVELKRVATPLCSQSRPVRRNRGTKMKMFLLEEKRGLCEEIPAANRSTSKKTKPSNRARSSVSDRVASSKDIENSYMAPVDDCSDDGSWSFYSDDGSCNWSAGNSPSMADSWSHYSGDEGSFVTPDGSEGDSLSSCSFTSPKKAQSRKRGTSDIKANTPKKTRKVQCFICTELVNISLRNHMKTHFPTGDYACPRCDSRFRLFSSFKQHMNRTCFESSQQQVDPEKPDEAKNLYKCDTCQEAFRYKVSLRSHKLTHNELYCDVCRKVLRSAETLARHKASHTLFQCNRCDETFTLFKPLRSHCENVHKMNRPFKCNHCPKVFSKLRILIVHEWKHTGRLPYQCAQCGLKFRTDGDLISHERVHTREKPFLCAECGKSFAQRSNMLRHLNFIHGESRDVKKHSCTECGKSFKEKGALIKHQRRKHLKELFRHPCSYCGKMVSASTIARHKLIHTGERPFKCTKPDCDRHFRSASEVKRHVLLHHTSERPYKCDVCGKGFIKQCYLNTHAKVHSGVKPFVCHICGKAFPKLYSMQRHKKLVHAFA